MKEAGIAEYYIPPFTSTILHLRAPLMLHPGRCLSTISPYKATYAQLTPHGKKLTPRRLARSRSLLSAIHPSNAGRLLNGA